VDKDGVVYIGVNCKPQGQLPGQGPSTGTTTIGPVKIGFSDCLKKIFGSAGGYITPGVLFPRPVDLDRVNFHDGLPSFTKYAVIDVGDITIGYDIYFKDASQFTIANIAHELVHTEQYTRFFATSVFEYEGILKFALQYGQEYLAGKARGLSDQQAYNAISFEREANTRAEAITKDIESKHGQNPCGVPIR
jgi:hypothetical protein